MTISQEDQNDLLIAKKLLENPGFAARIIHILGRPVELGFQKLPTSLSHQISQISEKAIKSALDVALKTMSTNPQKISSEKFHKLAIAATGGAGGAFGISAIAFELPISTTILMRSIADIARSEGENIMDIETRLSCIEVFALGGQSKKDDGMETGYFAIRAMLANAVSEASGYILEKGVIDSSAPIILRFISNIASRFGIVVSEKLALTAIPVVGAASGLLINTLFMDHFQDMARGHFIIRRLERTYGKEKIKQLYQSIPEIIPVESNSEMTS